MLLFAIPLSPLLILNILSMLRQINSVSVRGFRMNRFRSVTKLTAIKKVSSPNIPPTYIQSEPIHSSDTSDDKPHLIEHLMQPSSRIYPYWIDQLKRVTTRPAKNLLKQLVPDNVIGHLSGKGNAATPYIQQMIDAKNSHPDKLILFRVGEFYETNGVDAVILVNYLGLTPTGGKAEAGFKIP
jgi:MutS domain I